MAFMPFQWFAPDADNTQSGVIVDCASLIPTFRGYKAAPSAVSVGASALSSACLGAAVLRKLDGSVRLIAGTSTALNELLPGNTWDDVSSGTYNATSDHRWSFAQYGNVSLASNKQDTIQYIESGANFAAISGAPKAALIETVNQFVIAANTNDAGFGDSPDRWWCCAIGDYTDWTPDTATQCVSGRLTSTPGRIIALKRLGDAIVAYKERSIFIGSYVGAPEVWSFQEVPGQVGCVAQNAVVDIGAAHVFLGYDNFWMYDGSRPVAIGNPIKNWFFSRLYSAYAYRIQTVHDRTNANVYFFYPSSSGNGALNSCIIYNYRTQKWGVDDRSIEAGIEYVSGGETFSGTIAGESYASVDSGIGYDSPLLVSGQPAPAVFDTSHSVYTLTGSGNNWNLSTNDYGSESDVAIVTRVTPRFLTKPTSSTLTNYYRMAMGDGLTSDTTSTLTNGRFDFIRSARWHRFVIAGSGGGEITGIDIQATGGGLE